MENIYSTLLIRILFLTIPVFITRISYAQNNRVFDSVQYVEYDAYDMRIISYGGKLVKYKSLEKWGLIDTGGKEITAAKYDNIGYFHHGIAFVMINAKLGFIDTSGNEIIPPIYENGEVKGTQYRNDNWESNLDHLLWRFYKYNILDVIFNGQRFIIDNNNNKIYNAKYDELYDACMTIGLISISVNGKWGFINLKGNVISTPKYDDPGILQYDSDTLGAVYKQSFIIVKSKDKYGVMNVSGKETIPPKYEVIRDLKDGLMFYAIHNKVGLIGKSGKEITLPKYDDITDFSEGLATISISGKKGLINSIGKEIVPPKYDQIGAFHNGYAQYKLNQQAGFLNKEGRETH
jgi:WG containing repeat